MADSEAKRKEKRAEKKRKRKQKGTEEIEQSPKRHQVSFLEQEEEEAEKSERTEPNPEVFPWRNLELILSIQNKDIDLQKKLELAFDFVMSRVKEGNAACQDCETVKISRVVIFLNDWVQSLLIPSGKRIKGDGEKHRAEAVETYLDFRCWKIFKFCLEESLKLHISLTFSRNLLRSISFIADNTLSLLNSVSSCPIESHLIGEGFELHSTVLDCLSLVFSSHGGLSNENLDLWLSTIVTVLELVHKIFSENLDCGDAGVYVLQLSCSIFEPFARFLRAHPTRKNGFHDFIDKLLEPMLHLLGILHNQIDGCFLDWKRKLLKLVEDVLSHGLFHPVHIDGFLSLRGSEKYVAQHGETKKVSKTVIKSYHRHLFTKLEGIVATKKELATSSIGKLFCLLADRVKNRKGALMMSENTKMAGKTERAKHLDGNRLDHTSTTFSESSIVVSEETYDSTYLTAEKRKSLFDFFLWVMEPLLLEINGYLQPKHGVGCVLSDAHCMLKSINSLLTSFMHEKVYFRTEDTSEGAYINFLKNVYNTVMSLSSNLIRSYKFDVNNKKEVEMLALLAEEVFVAVGYLLEIEYDVMGDELVGLWHTMFSYLVLGFSLTNVADQFPLFYKISDLGCQLFNLYSQLRQVNSAIFTMSKAIRLLISHNGDGEVKYTRFLTPLQDEALAKSVGMLLSSHEFKDAVHRALKSMPEGQASACLQHLIIDISESLKWMKTNDLVVDEKEFVKPNPGSRFNLRAELLGRGLSEVYALVLNSVPVTMGNSNLVGLSVKDLITALYPYMSSLVGLQPDAANKFLFSVTGISFDTDLAGNKSDLQSIRVSTHWIFLFFFQLYVSCRILYRQAASFMPPDSSRKMSAAMGDSFAAFSGGDWMHKTDWMNDDYFSCFLQPSASLLTVIQAVSNIFVLGAADCCPLTYVMHAMALQRLVDLNRQIKSFEYLLQNNDSLVQIALLDAADLSRYQKRNKKLGRRISILRQEAAGLTGFMMEHLSLVSKTQQLISASDDTTCEELSAHESDEWDFGVSSVNKKSLPTAVWWILCQNIDVWCTHAAKKKLKMYLSLLIHTSISYGRSSFGQFVRRHLASRFCRALEKSALPSITCSSGNVDFKSSPNWPEVLSDLENSLMIVSGKKNVMYDCLSAEKPELHIESGNAPNALPLTSMELAASQSLLNLIGWIPKEFFNSKSFSTLLTSILNLERLVIGALLDCNGSSKSHDGYELFRLFLCCRKVLKYIVMASCEGKTEFSQTSHSLMYSGNLLPVSWLFKSLYAVFGIRELLSKDSGSQVDDMIFPLLDHTLYVFLTLTKYHFNQAVNFIKNPEQSYKEHQNVGVDHEQIDLIECDQHLSSCDYIEAWESVFCVAKSLREQMQNLLPSLKDALSNEIVGVNANDVNLSRYSTIMSCFSGFLWGLASVMKETDVRSVDYKLILSGWKDNLKSEINLCISVFIEFSSLLVGMLVLNDAQYFFKASNNLDQLSAMDHLTENAGGKADISCGKQQDRSGDVMTCAASSDIDDNSGIGNVCKKRFQSKASNSAASFLTEVDSHQCLPLNKSFLRNLLKGDCPEAAFLLRQLLIASSAILRLNLHVNCAAFSATLMQIFTGVSQVLLSELEDMINVPHPLSFVWLDGIVKYLEELGNHFPMTDPTLSRNLYVKMVDLQLRAIGKYITFQGKRATLASHETESSTKLLHGHSRLFEASLPSKPSGFDEFKSRLRLSFTVFIKKPSELHLLSAIQTIERALVGVQERSTMIYNIQTGSANGGKVSSIVAAGIDCLDLVLEFVSGRKRLSVVKRHIQSLLASVFNIILHLQSPLIFYDRLMGDTDPDPGAVILMCVEVMIRISGKHALYQMEAWHVAQSLRIPGALFQDFHQLKLSRTSIQNSSSTISNSHISDPVESMQFCSVDRRFSIDLFAACCRLLYNVLKHHKSECKRCIAVLEASVCVLLQCLETVDSKSVIRNGYFSWEVEEGVKCAYCLRRIYEEIRHQKDVLGRHCPQFLSTYIWIYSGHGALKTGIKREIDEALRPGVYALIDACSPGDLQHLHTVFGEGPCRNTLATLQHDYKLNFQYEGKV
ncbi:Nucleolar 27S pre-rRNA processing, Urb2/Npa2, C-terminal [Trema orientale]|uniref:Nucleolar 27S pre-rRNA processing, Urb2/Npa2, C-terminal n=1 Tax=Trema orientale TaxID=63057 RepID=A0A2P5ED23_TREOI|nr:Nucleolar 27S pre-rRNA processing, Urb2/Npa2, C-terminal [Trema orientale]